MFLRNPSPRMFHATAHNPSDTRFVTFSSKQRSPNHNSMSSGIDELIASLPKASNEQLEAMFTVVVKTKAELVEAKRFLQGPLVRFHRSLLAEIRQREKNRS